LHLGIRFWTLEEEWSNKWNKTKSHTLDLWVKDMRGVAVLFRIVFLIPILLILQWVVPEGAWAWGPAVHTIISCRILDGLAQLFPIIREIIQPFPLEYIYGGLAADFFVGKGQKKKHGHSHNWETGFRFLAEAGDDREAAYAYGFLSHLAADVVAHNYFVPNLIHRASTWKRVGHLYWEGVADHCVSPNYGKLAREVLDMEELGCDDLLKSAVGKRRKGLKTRRQLFKQSVKLSDFLNGTEPMFLVNKASRYQISQDYVFFMLDLSYRLVKDFLTHPDSSPCLSHDPIGSHNLRLASRNGFLSKLLNIPQPMYQFSVDRELLKL
jgi:hypothetical protein